MTVPAIRTTVKIELSNRNDKIIVSSLTANENKQNARVALTSSNRLDNSVSNLMGNTFFQKRFLNMRR